MEPEEKISERESIELAYKEIQYYANLPKHIKRMASQLKGLKPTNLTSDINAPAHVVNGSMTVIMGKLNIPLLTHQNQFLERTISK